MAPVPLYERIRDRIRSDFLNGQSGDGVRLPAERELQALYGASRPTIAKALAALSAEGLVNKSQGRGSFAISRDDPEPAQGCIRRIGYVASIAGADLIQRTFAGICRAAWRRGFRAQLGASQNTVRGEREAALDLIDSGARGLIIGPCFRTVGEAEADHLATGDLGVPVVLVDTGLPIHGGTQVVFDNRRLGRSVYASLLARGHRRIGIYTCASSWLHWPLLERMRGYRDAAGEYGAEIDPDLVFGVPLGEDREAIPAALDHWLALREPPTAIIAMEDRAALDVVDSLQHRGVHVPDDIRVVGFDNLDAARRFRPAIATTNPDFVWMGETACDLLLDGLQEGRLPQQVYVLDVPLLSRRASDHPAAQRAGARALTPGDGEPTGALLP
ncbi:MAG: GntR family transcriptional regulator [Armatimonadetes bacterium]|nr:GntR family transcriptional regulator [Armatimonadota bacterium]